MEIHPDPDRALCDGPNSIPLGQVESILAQVVRIRAAVENSSTETIEHHP
jgi:2-dehydro-3-deoxyphosphooctonate aldolase (KDO 8-P synthase)